MLVIILVVLLFLALIGVGTYFVLTMNSVSMEDIAEKMISIDKEYPQIKLVRGVSKADIVKKLKNPHVSDKDKVKLFISVFTEGINKELNNLEIIQLWYDKIVKKFKHHNPQPSKVAIFEKILGIAQTATQIQTPPAPVPVLSPPSSSSTPTDTPVPTGATTSPSTSTTRCCHAMTHGCESCKYGIPIDAYCKLPKCEQGQIGRNCRKVSCPSDQSISLL